tara:strand:+ start:45 stop:1070 length:1026 start_codon:yes stop_codon:yes gene_type:complete
MKKNILILKNDRAGDLFTSLKLISSLNNKNNKIKLYLSELNNGFSFLFKNIEIIKTNYDLNINNRINIFLDILKNRYDEIYILSPKKFYFFLSIIFRKLKFFAIVYNGKKRNRPNYFIRKFLFSYEVIFRTKRNEESYEELQIKLLEKNIKVDSRFSNLNIPSISSELKFLLPKNFLFFQFRYDFFEDLKWKFDELEKLFLALLTKYENILFCSDIENNSKTIEYIDYFKKKYSLIDTNNYKIKLNNSSKKIFYLENLNAKNLFLIIKESQINLAKHGLVAHLSNFHSAKCHNLFNFKINNIENYHHQKFSYSEWYSHMNFKFSFLNNDINKAIRKILKFI